MDITSTEANGASAATLTDDDIDFMRQAHGQSLDTQQVTQVKSILAKDPCAWTMLGDLCSQVRFAAIASLANDTAVHESVREGVVRMRSALCSEGSSEMEQLLIEQILTCWVQCSMLGRKLEWTTTGVHEMEHGNYWDRRYTIAQARLLRTIESLARIRKLKLPSLQLNVADKQVNIVG